MIAYALITALQRAAVARLQRLGVAAVRLTHAGAAGARWSRIGGAAAAQVYRLGAAFVRITLIDADTRVLPALDFSRPSNSMYLAVI